jgi:hypothetical protein
MVRKTLRIIRVTGLCGALASAALAAINLEMRPLNQTVVRGDPVRVALYAVSDSGTNQLMSAADVILGWDPDVLRLTGLDHTGATPLLVSAFPTIDPYALNETVPPQDGDGFYLAYARGGQPVAATPAGTLLVTFVFDSIAAAPETEVAVLPSAGTPTGHSAVYDGAVPGLIVTGTLGHSLVEVRCMRCLADLDGDDDVDIADLAQLLAHYATTSGADPTDGDVDCDGDVDISDLAALLAVYSTHCD